jgi:hypothetical protein
MHLAYIRAARAAGIDDTGSLPIGEGHLRKKQIFTLKKMVGPYRSAFVGTLTNWRAMKIDPSFVKSAGPSRVQSKS